MTLPLAPDESNVQRHRHAKVRGGGLGSLRLLGLPLLLLAAGLAVSYRVAELQFESELERLRDTVHADLTPIRTEISRRVFSAVQLTEGIASLIAIDGDISPQRFRALAAELLSRSDSIRNIVVAPNNVVTQVFPLEGNEAVLGFRYADSEAQWPSVERMMADNHLVLAGPVQLVQGGVGVIARRPIDVPDRAGPNGRRYWGLTSTVIDFPDLIARTELEAATASYRLALRGKDGRGIDGAVFWGDANVFDGEPVVRDIPLPSGSWQLGGIPKAGWPEFHVVGSKYFQMGGIASVALAALVFMLLRVSGALKTEQHALRVAYENVEAQVVERTKELSVAKDEAESADRLKSAFLATMSHELRTPLNSIIGFTGILLQELAGPLNDEQQKQLGMVQGSARHLLALINDVLDISKIEAGELQIAAEPFDLRASIEKVISIVRPLAEKKSLALSVTVGESVAAMTGDSRRVEQILLNLLGNAIKFTESGSVTLAAMLVPDFKRNAEDAQIPAVRLQVTDTGIGIKPEHVALLFQPFRQVDSTLSRSHEGTGLGLAICRRLTELMHGAIAVQSRRHVGSVFAVTLPLHPGQASPIRGAAAASRDLDAASDVAKQPPKE